MADEIFLRSTLHADDRPGIATLLSATGFFNPEELDVAMELVDDRLANGEASHYRFLVAAVGNEVAGYACWGPIPGTAASADLYWIAVHPDRQGSGVGRSLLMAAERGMRAEGRTRCYLETSSRQQYTPTRTFYLRCGYRVAAELEDYYGPGDGKVVFLRVLE